jgi:HTH domain.
LRDEVLLQYLKMACRGKKNAVTGRTLETRLHIGRNELRKRIHRLRCRGAPVASTQQGYFYAVTAGELYTTVRQLEKLRAGIDAAIRGLEAALEGFGMPEGGP